MDVHTRSCSSTDPGSLSGSEPANSTELRKYNPIYKTKIEAQKSFETHVWEIWDLNISPETVYIEFFVPPLFTLGKHCLKILLQTASIQTTSN
jgi:hypothetical protein